MDIASLTPGTQIDIDGERFTVGIDVPEGATHFELVEPWIVLRKNEEGIFEQVGGEMPEELAAGYIAEYAIKYPTMEFYAGLKF